MDSLVIFGSEDSSYNKLWGFADCSINVFLGIDNNNSNIVSDKINAAKIVQLKSLIGGSLLIAIAIILGIKINLNLDQIPIIILLGAGGFGMSIFFFLHSLRRIGTVRSIVILST